MVPQKMRRIGGGFAATNGPDWPAPNSRFVASGPVSPDRFNRPRFPMKWHHVTRRASRWTALLALAIGSVATAADLARAPFFPFCIDWHDARKRSFPEQAQMLKELGYPGVGHIWLDKVEERLASLDAVGLRLFQITMTVDVTPGKTPYDAARFQAVLALIKGRQVQFCVTCKGPKSSDAAFDAHAVGLLRTMSELARDSGAQLLLYPHQKDWVERIEDAVRVAEQVDRPNVGVMFNLCHWLKVDRSRDYAPLLKQAMPRLWAISINGADEFDDQPNWKRYIQPLDQGSFDVGALLKTLQQLGYQGPIGLQCFGIGGDAREHLARSLGQWRELSRQLSQRGSKPPPKDVTAAPPRWEGGGRVKGSEGEIRREILTERAAEVPNQPRRETVRSGSTATLNP
jgi:sugar phosphate isomerase/epimerase